MSEKLYSSVFGAGTTGVGILSGLLNVSSVVQALILGFAGAIGGLIAQALWKNIKSHFKKQ